MNKNETVTISIDSKTLDAIRLQAVKNYRSINKHIQYLIDMALNLEGVK
jgi:hypothetical protein